MGADSAHDIAFKDNRFLKENSLLSITLACAEMLTKRAGGQSPPKTSRAIIQPASILKKISELLKWLQAFNRQGDAFTAQVSTQRPIRSQLKNLLLKFSMTSP